MWCRPSFVTIRPRVVVVEAERHAEAIAERSREQTRSRGRPDEGERREVERERARRRSLTDHDVEPEILERGIEDLLDRAVQSMDLVDEQNVVSFEAGEDRCHIALA